MYHLLLFLHFIGVAIGAGTGIYLLALTHHANRHLEQAEARTLIPGVAGALSRVGSLGLLLLIASGLGMLYSLGAGILHGVFLAKLALVLVLVLFVVMMHRLAWRVRSRGDVAAAQTMKSLAMFGPLLAVLIIAAAVMAFH